MEVFLAGICETGNLKKMLDIMECYLASVTDERLYPPYYIWRAKTAKARLWKCIWRAKTAKARLWIMKYSSFCKK